MRFHELDGAPIRPLTRRQQTRGLGVVILTLLHLNACMDKIGQLMPTRSLKRF